MLYLNNWSSHILQSVKSFPPAIQTKTQKQGWPASAQRHGIPGKRAPVKADWRQNGGNAKGAIPKVWTNLSHHRDDRVPTLSNEEEEEEEEEEEDHQIRM